MAWLKRWWPALLWAAVISGFSTGAFTGEHTSRFIIPILHWLMPQASPDRLEFLHHIIRKCGHLTEYFILSLLILRGFRAGQKGMHLRWTLLTILLILGYAALDEYHQSFVPGRTAAVGDVLIDTCGGIVAQIAAGLVTWWHRARHKPLESTASAGPARPAQLK
jgi:VanZ family protein